MLGFIRRALNHSTAELQLLIVSMSSPTIGNTNVSGRQSGLLNFKRKGNFCINLCLSKASWIFWSFRRWN